MNNKVLYEDWLTRFKQNINGKKFTSVNSYLKYMKAIERQLTMTEDSIYSISNASELKKLEAKLRKVKTFTTFSDKYQANLLSALHVYQNRMDMLSNVKTKPRKNVNGK